nr:ATP-binding protein [Rubrivivax gelatinosus]
MLAFAAGVMGAVTYHNVLAETEALFDYQLRQMALSLRDQGEIAPDQAGALADRELDFVIQIWSADGQTIYASRPHDELPARAQLGFADVSAGKQTWRTFTALRGQRVIQVAQPRQIRQRLAAGAALRSVAPLVGIAPLIALLTWAAATRVLRPLRQVARSVRAREPHSLAPLPATGLPEELSPLVQALNGLLAQLAQAMDTQRAFVADAAHELRSPLQALKLQIRLLERAGDETARASGTELDLQAPAPVPLQGDAASLAVLVRNLVDNAVRHSPPGTRVAVSAALEDGAPQLVVDDAGPGIPVADRERVFDRFYRRDPGAGDGSGLGLAIVRTIATRHGAAVTLGDSPLGGLRATVRFPPV